MDLASIRIITHDVDRLVRFYEAVTGTVAARPATVFAEFRTATGTLAIADHHALGQQVALLRVPGGNLVNLFSRPTL